MKDLLMVIDTQKAYLKGAPWECLDTEGAVKNIVRLIDAGAADEVVITRYEYPKAPEGVWKEYNEVYADINADPVNEEFVDELLPYAERFPVFVKDIYGSFSVPEIREAVRRTGADTLVVCGVVAECCVLSTVMGAVDEGYKVSYLTDAVSGFTEEKMAGVLAVLSARRGDDDGGVPRVARKTKGEKTCDDIDRGGRPELGHRKGRGPAGLDSRGHEVFPGDDEGTHGRDGPEDPGELSRRASAQRTGQCRPLAEDGARRNAGR